MASETYQTFVHWVRDIYVAQSVEGVLDWDQETYMPPKGAQTRAAQIALVAGVAHERLIDDGFGRLLAAVEREADPDPDVATNAREMRRIYDRRIKLPTALVQEIAAATTLAKSAWVKARKEARFELFEAHLERLLDLKRQVAELIGYVAEPYDALLDEYEPGACAADVQHIFDDVRTALVPLVAALRSAPRQPQPALLTRPCPLADQATFARRVVAAMGFDFEAGRIDVTTHPFCSGASPHDVRLTTRYDEHYLPMALFGLMHEAGHGLYEQGLDPTHAFTPRGSSVSLGIHESQSRMWENLVGRGRPFWKHWFPQLQAAFPAYADVALDDWHHAINTVRPSFIRVEADEVTYNLHIMLRFDIERRMVSGRLAVQDVPAAWNEAFRAMFGLTPPDDALGCLQDIHWSMGMFGYFPTYALGNLYACQFFAAARRDLADLDEQIARGELLPLRAWLRENVHRHGQRYRAGGLVQVVTGAPLSHEAFLDYLDAKYRPLYGLA